MNLKSLRVNAKSNLKNKYFKFFLLSLIAFLISIEIVFVFEEPINILNMFKLSYIMVLTGIFVRPVYILALKKAYLTGESGEIKSFYKINKSCYVKTTAAFLIRRIMIFSGSLIFLIPGIYIAIEYIFLPYIIADNQDMELNELFLKAKALTKGKKLIVFKFVLSFLWRYISGFFLFGIGILFVNPYFEMCLKELYIKMSLDK